MTTDAMQHGVGHPRVPTEVLGAEVVVRDPTNGPDLDTTGLNDVPALRHFEEIAILAARDRAVVTHRDIGDFEVEAGATVVVHPRPGAHPERIRTILHGLIATIVLGQQGRFALHASTVDIGSRRVAIAGHSGLGKSTTATRLVQRGATPVIDDITILDLEGSRAWTSSWGRDTHIWPDVAEKLGIDVTGAVMTAGPRAKWSLRWPEAHAAPIDLAVVLRKGAVDMPVAHEVLGLDALRMLGSTVHFRRVLNSVWPQELLTWQARLARTVRAVRLTRPIDGESLDQVCDLIEGLVASSTTP